MATPIIGSTTLRELTIGTASDEKSVIARNVGTGKIEIDDVRVLLAGESFTDLEAYTLLVSGTGVDDAHINTIGASTGAPNNFLKIMPTKTPFSSVEYLSYSYVPTDLNSGSILISYFDGTDTYVIQDLAYDITLSKEFAFHGTPEEMIADRLAKIKASKKDEISPEVLKKLTNSNKEEEKIQEKKVIKKK